MALLFACAPRHEPWFDEAQAWMIAQDEPVLTIVGTLGRQEGTPVVWHLLLRTLQGVGLPYGLFWLVSGALGIVGVSLVLFCAPLPRWARLSFAASFFAFYQLSIVARSYSLDLALLPLAAALFERRLQRPLAFGSTLALLASANAFSLLLSGCFAIEFACRALRPLAEDVRRPRLWMGLGLVAVGLALAIAQLAPRPAAGVMACCELRPNGLRPLVLITEAFADPAPFGPDASGVGAILAMFAAAAILATFSILWRRAGHGLLALGMFASQSVLAAQTEGHLGHSGLFFLTGVTLLWISWASLQLLASAARSAVLVSLAFCLAQSDLDNFEACYRDFVEPYSGSKAAATFIATLRQAFPQKTIAAAGFKTFAIQPYMRRNVFANATVSGGGGYFRWTRDFAVPRIGGEVGLAKVAAGGFDAIVVSDDDGAGGGSIASLIQTGKRVGYRPLGAFRGSMIWKARTIQRDDLVVFGRADEGWDFSPGRKQ